MSNLCFIVASMNNRSHLLNKCISALANSKYKKCDKFLYFQGDISEGVQDLSLFTDVIVDRRARGVFTPRYQLMKKYSINYDYTIIIDDDLYVTEQTNYELPIEYIETNKYAGCVSTSNTIYKDTVEHVKVTNVNGGLVIPRRSVEIILDYFADKEMDYSADAFWYLLWIKGYELYKDWRSVSIHRPSIKVNGKPTGYHASMVQKPYIQIMPEWFNEPKKRILYGREEHMMLELKDLNQSGMNERDKNYKRLHL